MLHPAADGNAHSSLTPARRVRKLLGAKDLAVLCDRTTDAIRKWDRPKSKGGLGGLIPSEFQARILATLRARGHELAAEDLIAEPIP